MTDAFSKVGSGITGALGELSADPVQGAPDGVTLVTGAAGFIGRHVVSQLGSAGGGVIAIEHAWHCRRELESLLGTSAVDRCIHVGWYANPADYLSSEIANLVSLRSSIDLLAVLMSRGCQHMTVAGTSAEYRPSAFTLSERDDVEQATPYAHAKATFRDLTAELSRLHVLPTAWCRIFNVAGPGEQPGRLLPLVACALLAGSPLDLTDGTQVRDYLDVRDVAAGLVAVSGAGLSGPVNLCSGEGVRLKDLISDLASRCGPAELLRFGALRRRPGDPDTVVGDNTRLRNEARWQPSKSRSQMLDDVVEYWRSRLEER
jgi:nucleoside-diphosphate-sugar epimerase